jgi:hypothetical protein
MATGDDRTFYFLSYTLFCLAMIIPFVYFLIKANRRE